MTSTTISPEQTLTIVKHLANGKPLEVVAAIMRLPRAAIDHIAEQHGHPDRVRLAWAVDELTRQVDHAGRDRLPAGTTPTPTERTRPTPMPTPTAQRPSPTPSTPQPRPTTAAPGPAAVGEPTPSLPAKPDEFRVLINTAKNHDRKRIQRLAEKILDDCAKLRRLIDDEAAAYAARQAEAKEKAAARAEIERLERELAAAKAKLRPPAAERPASTKTASKTSSTTDGPSTAEIRAWAHDHDVDCPTVGRLPQAVRDAYSAAHPDLRAAS